MSVKGRPTFTIKVSFEDEDDIYYLYGKYQDKIHQVDWLRTNVNLPEPSNKKHLENDSIFR